MPRAKTGVQKEKDNPNPAANIGFLCHTHWHFHVFLPVLRHLANAELVVEGLDDGVGRRGLEQFLRDQKVPWRRRDKSLTGAEFYAKYAVLVDTFFDGAIAAPYNRDKKKVRLVTGYGLEPWNFGPWNAYFDLVLSPGPYANELLAPYGNSRVVGDPRFDEWLPAPKQNRQRPTPQNKRDSVKPTIVYAPAFGNLSSIDILAGTLHHASREFKVFVIPHPKIVEHEDKRLEPYRDSARITIVQESDNPMQKLSRADVVVGDNGESMFDALLFDRPLVLINFLDKALFHETTETIYSSMSQPLILTDEDSLEQQVKEPGEEIGPVIVRKPTRLLSKEVSEKRKQVEYEHLKNAIEVAIEKKSRYDRQRRLLTSKLFVRPDGGAGRRAAGAIIHLLHSRRSRQNLIAQGLTLYTQSMQQQWEREQSGGDREIASIVRRQREIRKLPPIARLRRILEEYF